MPGQSSLIWIVILLLVLIIVLLSICLYFDIKPILATLTTTDTASASPDTTSAPNTSDTPTAATTAPPATANPSVTTAASVTTAPPVTTEPSVTEPSVTEPPVTELPAPDPDAPTICIDPGHGFGDPGTLGKLNGTTYYENDINLAISFKLGKALTALGYNVVYTHDGTTLPPEEYLSTSSPIYNVNNRCDWIIDNKNIIDLVISVHCNAYTTDTSVMGSRYYILPYGYTGYTAKSNTLANCIVTTVKNELALSKLPTIYPQKLAVLQSGLPSVLLECGFMTNAYDLANLTNSAWQTKYAEAVANGIDAYCKQYIQ